MHTYTCSYNDSNSAHNVSKRIHKRTHMSTYKEAGNIPFFTSRFSL